MDRERLRGVLAALAAAGEGIFAASGYPHETVEAEPDTLLALGEALACVRRARDLVARELGEPAQPFPRAR